MKALRVGLLVATCAACAGGTSTPLGDGGVGDAGATEVDAGETRDGSEAPPDAASLAPFALTSTRFTEGETLPTDATCNGLDQSPPLAWTSAGRAAQSYAVVLKDRTISFLHAAIYDIPASVFALPANVEKSHAPPNPAGAKQARSFRNNVVGYAGPCPPRPTEHVYDFTLYALDVAALPGMTASTSLADVEAELERHVVATAVLSGKYKQP